MNVNKTAVSIASLGFVAVLGIAGCSTDSSSGTSASATPTATESATATTLNTIPEVAAQAGDFTTLVDAVTAAGLVETLSSGEYTVFAPTNAAFQPLVSDGTVEELLKDPQGQLTQILTYHVVEGKVTAADVAKLNGQDVTTVQGGKLKVDVTSDGKVTLTDSSGNTVNVTDTDIEASNGVIHVIDGVLIPKS